MSLTCSQNSFRIKVLLLFGIFILAVITRLTAQEEHNNGSKVTQEFQHKSDSSSNKHHRSIQAFPTVFYTPETNFGFGASGLAIFRVQDPDTNLTNSFISLSANITLNKQLLFTIKHEINFTQHFLIRGEVGYFHYPDVYSGYGNSHAAEKYEKFTATYPRFQIDMLRRSKKNLIYGVRFAYQNTTMEKIADGGILATEKPPGYQGSLYSALGLVLNYDSRDYIFAPTNGWYSEISFLVTDKIFGATFNDDVLFIDIRNYTPFLTKHVLAFQFTSEMHSGVPAFNNAAIIGGEYSMRGYRYGIFRDFNSYVFQTEFRSVRFWKYFTGTLFSAIGGVGSTYDDAFKNTRLSYGLGLWVYPQPKKRLFVRFDYGQGWEPHQSHGFYVSMGNAF